MGYGGLSNILDRINQARGDAPAEPWSERLPNGASANNPGMRPPIVIEPQDDAPNTRTRGAMQLDSSNLAGPVPTNLSGDSQPFDYNQILNRGTTDSGQPQMDTSPARVDAIQSPTQGRFTADSMGVPRETPNASGMPPTPRVPLYTRNKNSAGQVRPIVDTYQQGVDANGNHIGRGARFVDSFLANGGIGNPVGALFGGLLGLAAPSLGNRAAYNLDNSRFNRGLQQDLSNERADPGYQKQLDVWQQQAEVPGKAQLYGLENDIANKNRMALDAQKATEKTNQINLTASHAMDRIKEQFQGKTFLANKAAQDKATQEIRSIAAGFAGNAAYDAMSDREKEEFVSDKWQEQRQAKLDKSVAEESRAEEAAMLSKERRENPEKFRAPSKGPGGITANYQMRLRLKPIEDKQRATQAQINVWNKKRAAGDITDAEYSDRVAPLNAQKEVNDAEWKQAASVQEHDANPVASGASDQVSGKTHPKTGKPFTGPDGKQYIADEIDSDGNITRYHPKP